MRFDCWTPVQIVYDSEKANKIDHCGQWRIIENTYKFDCEAMREYFMIYDGARHNWYTELGLITKNFWWPLAKRPRKQLFLYYLFNNF